MRWTLILPLITAGMGQAVVLANNCPAGYPNEIFCDDFDTYCPEGGYPGDPKCSTSTMDNGKLRSVWYRTSIANIDDSVCGTEFKVEDEEALIFSPPLGGRYPSKVELGQSTVRDWVSSPPLGDPVQILNIHRLVKNVFGPEYAAVAGTDGNPLIMEFMAAANVGKLYFSSGFMELAFGDESYTSRANTDYVMSPNCATYCSPTIGQGPFPILCAQGNPYSALPVGCPSISTNPPPIHQAIAVGALTPLDTDPCHCGSSMAHGPQNSHLALFDGQLWWIIRRDNPVSGSGTVTPLEGAPMPPPGDVYIPGNFSLSLGENSGKSSNRVILTVRTNTLKVELTSRIKASNGFSYEVYNVMDGIPRKYTGPFDRIRGGVGPGCVLASNTSWSTCTSGTDRDCLSTPNGYFVDFDDFVLHGGTGYTSNGACCLDNGSCTDNVSELACEAESPAGLGGVWGGASTTCATITVPCCPVPFADSDHDGDVDQVDFGLFQACFTGLPAGIPSECYCFDRDGDNDIDGVDFMAFTNCWSGPSVPWTSGSHGCLP